MRLSVLALTLLASGLPLAARAQAAQDRYGSPSPDASPPAAGATLRGPKTDPASRPSFLSWAGKTNDLRGPEGDGAGLRGPAPLDTSTGYAVRSVNATRFQGAASQQASAPQTRVAYAGPPPATAMPAQSQRLPTSLYDQGDGTPAPAARPTQPVQQGRPLPAPQPSAAAQPQAQGQAQGQVQAQGQGDETTPRYYSLHREYGLQPDPIPPAEPSVLALAPTVAQAMADNKDDGPPIDLAGEDQAAVAAPPRLRNPTTGTVSSTPADATTSTSADGQTTTTYTIHQQ